MGNFLLLTYTNDIVIWFVIWVKVICDLGMWFVILFVICHQDLNVFFPNDLWFGTVNDLWFAHHCSATIQPISTKFGTVMQIAHWPLVCQTAQYTYYFT